ncbi:MAG: hypothetical protein JXR25_08295 [Pontiellaceae bacterium]|nr:hypothetical protein [Pontiellaceae bacterium]MBN2784813.1 hypothetical protein [Pontiellaceae bacterium]
MKRLYDGFFCILLSLMLLSLSNPAYADLDLGNIWALGDSITWGASDSGGYRDPLYTNLTGKGYSFQFVGTRSDNSTTRLSNAVQQWHDGWSAYGIADFSYVNSSGTPYNYSGLYDQVTGWYNSLSQKPDMTLLMIGINDLNQRYDEEGAPERLDLLMTRLLDLNPDMEILVSTLPDADSNNTYRHNPPNNDLSAAIVDYNTAMAGIVATRRAAGEHITLVDMHAGLTLTDLSDGLHPNAAGYDKMAAIWTDAIVSIPEPSSINLIALFGGGIFLARSSRKANH